MIGSPVLPLPLDPLNGPLTSMFGGGKAPVKWVLKDYSSKKRINVIFGTLFCVCAHYTVISFTCLLIVTLSL